MKKLLNIKKLSLLLIAGFCLSNCQIYMDELNRQTVMRNERSVKKANIKKKVEDLKISNPKQYKMVKERRLYVGMLEEYVLYAFGEPTRINDTCNQNICMQQYVYEKNTYIGERAGRSIYDKKTRLIHIMNGKVKSWTNYRN